VQLDRATGDGFDKAFINLPVIEGCKLKTGKDGRAEVEFEDGSALRLALTQKSISPISRLGRWPEAQRRAARLRHRVRRSSPENLRQRQRKNRRPVSVEFRPRVGHRLRRRALPRRTRQRQQSNRSRIQRQTKRHGPRDSSNSREAQRTLAFAKDDAANHDRQTTPPPSRRSDAFVLAKNYDDDPSDAWDRHQTEYHDRYATARAAPASPRLTLRHERLNYYGNFMTCPASATSGNPTSSAPIGARSRTAVCLLSRRRLHVRVRLSLDGCPTTTAPGPTLRLRMVWQPAIGIPGTRCQWW